MSIEARPNFMRVVMRAWQKVFSFPAYIITAIVFTIVAFLFAVLLPNIGLIIDVFIYSSVSLGSKLRLMMSLIGSIRTNFSFFSAVYTILVSFLFGINIAMIVYYLKKRIQVAERGGLFVGFGGMVSGMLGIGCAACGSFILTTALSFVGASGALALLPLRGGEFGVVSVILLGISIYLISRKITDSLVCNPV